MEPNMLMDADTAEPIRPATYEEWLESSTDAGYTGIIEVDVDRGRVMTPVEALTAARDLITDPDRWTTRGFALGVNDAKVLPTSPDAVKWCAAGALIRVTEGFEQSRRDAGILLLVAACHAGWRGIPDANDLGGHAAVLAVFDAAIAKAG